MGLRDEMVSWRARMADLAVRALVRGVRRRRSGMLGLGVWGMEGGRWR